MNEILLETIFLDVFSISILFNRFRFNAIIPSTVLLDKSRGLRIIGISRRNLESLQRYSVSSSALFFPPLFSPLFSLLGWPPIDSESRCRRACFDFAAFFPATNGMREEKLDVLVLFIVNRVQSINSSRGEKTESNSSERFTAAAPADSARETHVCCGNT